MRLPVLQRAPLAIIVRQWVYSIVRLRHDNVGLVEG